MDRNFQRALKLVLGMQMAKNARGSGCRAKRHAEIPLVQLTVRRRGQRRREAELKTLRLTGHVKMRQVFIPGGQPSITYVDRDHLGIERSLVKAIKLPSTIVSLTKQEADLWQKVCGEFKLANEFTEGSIESTESGAEGSTEVVLGVLGVAQAKFGLTGNGSRIKSVASGKRFVADNMQRAIDELVSNDICLVVDDFHYIDGETRGSIIRTLKGAVFRGLKVVLLSTPHRAFDAIRGEAEITGGSNT